MIIRTSFFLFTSVFCSFGYVPNKEVGVRSTLVGLGLKWTVKGGLNLTVQATASGRFKD